MDIWHFTLNPIYRLVRLFIKNHLLSLIAEGISFIIAPGYEIGDPDSTTICRINILVQQR